MSELPALPRAYPEPTRARQVLVSVAIWTDPGHNQRPSEVVHQEASVTRKRVKQEPRD